MTSKAYSIIAMVFIALYILTSIGEAFGLPGWVHQICTVIFASSVFLSLRKKKKENQSQ